MILSFFSLFALRLIFYYEQRIGMLLQSYGNYKVASGSRSVSKLIGLFLPSQCKNFLVQSCGFLFVLSEDHLDDDNSGICARIPMCDCRVCAIMHMHS